MQAICEWWKMETGEGLAVCIGWEGDKLTLTVSVVAESLLETGRMFSFLMCVGMGVLRNAY